MKWISKILAGKSSKTHEDVDPDWAKRIEAFLAPLDHLPEGKGRSGLARDIFAYVLQGDPKAILNEVSGNRAIGEHLQVLRKNDSTYMAGLYAGFSSLPPEICLRWAYLLRASAHSDPRYSFCFQAEGDISWAEVLILHASDYRAWPKPEDKFVEPTLECFERLLVRSGQPAAALLVSAFATPVAFSYETASRLQIVSYFDDFSQALERHTETVRPLIVALEVRQKLHVLAMLARASEDALAEFARELCELGTASSKQVRAAAEPLICRCGAPAIKDLKGIAVEGKPEQRVHALGFLWELAGKMADEQLRTFARETAAADKAASVQALVAEWNSALRAEEVSGEQYDYSLPVIDWKGPALADIAPLLERFRRDLDAWIASVNADELAVHRQRLAKGYQSTLKELPVHPDSLYESLRDYIVSNKAQWPVDDAYRKGSGYAAKAILKLADDPAMTPVALLKMLHFFDILLCIDAVDCLNRLHHATGRPTLLELQVMLEDLGHPDPASRMFDFYCHNSGFWSALADDWSNDAVWPFFAHNRELLLGKLAEPRTRSILSDHAKLFQAIGTLPTPPAQIVDTLFSLALGPGKADRPLAQAALAKQPAKEERIIEALADGKAETRTNAAQWLGRLRHTPAIPALEQALRKEKIDGVKGALLDALHLLGQPVTKYVDRRALAAEAARVLAKGLPKELEWFPWGALPVVRWVDSGEPVAETVLRWMIVQAVKQKSPEPGAVLQKYCSMFHPRDRENFGQFILETWLRQDTAPLPAEEAQPKAAAEAQALYDKMRQSPYYYQDHPHFNRSVEELKALALLAIQRQPVGSAIASKGLLAVAGACAAQGAPAPVKRYLKDFYGTRAAQGKALIAMLAWIEHPSATQLLLSISNRFRPKGFQEEATRQIEALAERKGWTVEELADRTIPSAGFDEHGDLELSYGPRVFMAKLLPDFKIQLFTPEGKKIAALPEPRAGDDTGLAKEAKKDLSAAKRDIKTTVALQSERLYEALCTERDWPFADWHLYLNRHPIMRRLVQRLVWVQAEEGNVLATFRPLEDGTLTDVDDNEVRLPDAARVRLAHDSLLAEGDIRRWQQHLVDYEITPLFHQLGKGVYVLPAEKANADSIEDFQGYLLDAFALRGRAQKLGYMRGQSGDGGWVTEYEKRFPTLGLTAAIEFTGTPPVQENYTVALLRLSFRSSNNESYMRSRIALGKIPPILLSECYHDLRLVAAEGAGFDPEWRKKVDF